MKGPSTERSFAWRSFQVIARILTTLLFDLKVFGQQNVPRRGGALIVSNHQGNLDPVLMAVRLDRPLNYIAKSELFQNWLSSRILRILNAFPVRQGGSDITAVKETIHRLREGHLLNMYPEGTRTEDGQIGELKKGVALIIRRSGAPVVPAIIVGSFAAWPIHRRWFRPWPVRIKYGPPINLADKQPDEIIATIDRVLRTMYDQFCNDLDEEHASRSPEMWSRKCKR